MRHVPRPYGHRASADDLAFSRPHPMPNPEITHDLRSLDLRAVAGTWGIAVVRSREEKAVAERLEAVLGVHVYLPMVCERRVYRKSVADLMLAACPGYLFVAWEKDAQYSEMWNARGVFEVRREARQAQLVDQMCVFQRALASDGFRRVGRWIKGQPVEIRQGHPLAGVRGWIRADRKSNIVQVGYPLMGYVAEVEIDAVWLELVDGASVAA